jgi:hypothetical protein
MPDACGVAVFWNDDEARILIIERELAGEARRPSRTAAPAESWRERDARAALANARWLEASEDDKCANCGEWTATAAKRYDLEEVCGCDPVELETLLGEDVHYPDLWHDAGTSRVVPFSLDRIEELRTRRGSVDDHLCAREEQEAGARRAEDLISRWANTEPERVFLRALAVGHDQGEARRMSGLLHPQHLLRRIRRAA